MTIISSRLWLLVLLFFHFQINSASELKSSLSTTSAPVTVYNEDQLKASIQDYAIINLGNDIYIKETLKVSNVNDVLINGFGYKINGNHSVQCFNINNGSSIAIHHLQITACTHLSNVRLIPLPHLFSLFQFIYLYFLNFIFCLFYCNCST